MELEMEETPPAAPAATPEASDIKEVAPGTDHAPSDAETLAEPAAASAKSVEEKLQPIFGAHLETLTVVGGDVAVFDGISLDEKELRRFHVVKTPGVARQMIFQNQKVVLVCIVEVPHTKNIAVLCAVKADGTPVEKSFVGLDETQMFDLTLSEEACSVNEAAVVTAAQEFIGTKIIVPRQRTNRSVKKPAATVAKEPADTARSRASGAARSPFLSPDGSGMTRVQAREHAEEIKALVAKHKTAVRKATAASKKAVAAAVATAKQKAESTAKTAAERVKKAAKKQLAKAELDHETTKKRLREVETEVDELKRARPEESANKENSIDIVALSANIEAKLFARFSNHFGPSTTTAPSGGSVGGVGGGGFTPAHHHHMAAAAAAAPGGPPPPGQWGYSPWGASAYGYGGPPHSAGAFQHQR